MPRLSVYAMRAALIHLALGFTFGGLILANKGAPFYPGVWVWLPAHVEWLLVGWTAQLALGVAFWILPRYSGGSRGNERLAWAALGLLNLGVWLIAARGFLGLAGAVFFAGRLAEAAAALLFALHAWGRVRPTYL